MELRLKIGYRELMELIKQLPVSQIRKLKADLALIASETESNKERNKFQEFLLKGPVMEEDQYQDFLANRQHFDAWRAN